VDVVEAHVSAAKIAVVIPAFNPGAYLAESVGSVLRQTMPDFELVVVDDGSDRSEFPLLEDDQRIRVIRQPNAGVSAARNCGVAETSAPLVAFLDADDRWMPTMLERQLAALTDHPECVLGYSGFSFMNPAGEVVAEGGHADPTSYLGLFASNPLAPSASVVRREAFTAVNGFDVFYSITADYDLWLRLASIGPFIGIGETLMHYRMAPHGVGQMSGDWLTAYLETKSIFDRHDLRARRTQDAATLAAIADARRAMRRMRAEQATAHFLDMAVRHRSLEWTSLGASLSVSPVETCRVLAHRAARAVRRMIPRHPG
jgi:GT2 family glycosyltransferase